MLINSGSPVVAICPKDAPEVILTRRTHLTRDCEQRTPDAGLLVRSSFEWTL